MAENFNYLISEQKLASFYIYAHNFHENSLEIWQKTIKEKEKKLDLTDFALTRRVLKIILEQSCGIKLKGCANFSDELYKNIIEYQKYLEELIYVGTTAIVISDYIARSQLFPKTVGFKILEENLEIYLYYPYDFLYEYIDKDIPRHNENIEYINIIEEFRTIWKNELGVDYGLLGSIVLNQADNFNYRFSVIRNNDLVNTAIKEFDY